MASWKASSEQKQSQQQPQRMRTGLFVLGTIFLALGVIDGENNFEKFMKPTDLTSTGVTLVLGGAVTRKSGNSKRGQGGNSNGDE